MTITQFFKDCYADFELLSKQKDPFKEVAEQRVQSLFLRGFGVVVLVSSTLNFLNTPLTPQMKVASLVYKLLNIAIGYDLIVIGLNQRAEIGGSAKRAIGNILSSYWNNGHRLFEGTLIVQHVYKELKPLL